MLLHGTPTNIAVPFIQNIWHAQINEVPYFKLWPKQGKMSVLWWQCKNVPRNEILVLLVSLFFKVLPQKKFIF